MESCRWQRLPHEYHGSGCTLASAIAGLLSHGLGPPSAVRRGQAYTYKALQQAYAIGGGQYLPHRLFWSRSEKAD